MKKIKRVNILLLTFILLILSVAGCGKKTVTEPKLNIIEDNYRNYYEIFVYSYYDTNGDGVGDINGVISQLDYIKDLGCNGIWLMPIMQSTTYHKYDVVDYCSVDKEYGTIEDFKRLVDKCHRDNIRVVIDMVMNHTSSKHPWFVNATDYLKGLGEDELPDPDVCPYVEYYNFAREQINKDYYRIGTSDWYYEGVFWSEMPDLNLHNENVIKEFEDIASFWIDLGVDGFRMDAAVHFEEGDIAFNEEVLNNLYTYCKGINKDFYMVSEVWTGFNTIKDYYSSNTPSMFNFDAGGVEGKIIKTAKGQQKAEDFVITMKKYQDDILMVNPEGIDAPFITNHDMGRVNNALIGKETDIKMAGGLLLTMNGSPFIYYGEEIGLPSKGIEDENKRIAMLWSKDPMTQGMTNGPANADKDIVSKFEGAYEQQRDDLSIYNYYKKALRIRNENPEIARGTITIIEEFTKDHQAVILKTYEGSTIAIVYNTGKESCQIDINKSELKTMNIVGMLNTGNEEISIKKGIITMPAQSICFLK